MDNAVKRTESAVEAIPGDTSTVVAGGPGKGLKKAESALKPVTSKRQHPHGTHPDPLIAQTVATMSLAGFTSKQMAKTLKLSLETLGEHYHDEMENGKTRMMTDVVSSLAQRAISGSDTAAIFLAKSRLGWSDRHQVELTGKDGGAIQIEHRMLLDRLAGALEQGITLEHEATD